MCSDTWCIHTFPPTTCWKRCPKHLAVCQIPVGGHWRCVPWLVDWWIFSGCRVALRQLALVCWFFTQLLMMMQDKDTLEYFNEIFKPGVQLAVLSGSRYNRCVVHTGPTSSGLTPESDGLMSEQLGQTIHVHTCQCRDLKKTGNFPVLRPGPSHHF